MSEEETITVESSQETIVDANVEFEDEDIAEVESCLEQDQEVLTVKEAAFVLGKSIRALERSLLGKWGNKLPDGWTAVKKTVDGQECWQILPPRGFRCEHLLKMVRNQGKTRVQEFTAGLSPESMLKPIRSRFEPIMETRQVPQLLRELSNAHRELAEQRRQHMDDLRTLFELQSSMRLLEVNATETAKLRSELVAAQRDLIALRNQYKEFMALPWWKRLFRKAPGRLG